MILGAFIKRISPLIVSINFCLYTHASAQVFELPDGISKAQKLVSVEHIQISKNMHVPGHELCQDGQYLYYRSVSDCMKHEKSLLSCRQLSPIAPMSELEEIYLDEQQKLIRFFQIQKQYEVATYKIIEDTLPARYQLVGVKLETLATCQHTPSVPERAIMTQRLATNEQKYLVHSLLQNNVPVINMPYSSLTEFEISAPQIVLTPFCNDSVESEEIFETLSGGGEGSGGFIQLQKLSMPLKINAKLNQADWQKISKKPFDKSIEAFEVACAPKI